MRPRDETYLLIKLWYIVVIRKKEKAEGMRQRRSIVIINLELNGKNNLEIMNNGILENITLVSLDLSNNKNDFESYMETINKFLSLKVLNLSYNQISIIKEKQFERLIKLEILDLSYKFSA